MNEHDLTNQMIDVAASSWQETQGDDPAFEQAQDEYDDAVEREYQQRSKELFTRRARMTGMYFRAQLDEGLPREIAINNCSAMESWFWQAFYKDGMVQS